MIEYEEIDAWGSVMLMETLASIAARSRKKGGQHGEGKALDTTSRKQGAHRKNTAQSAQDSRRHQEERPQA